MSWYWYSSLFVRGAELETLSSHGQSLLRGESAQGHVQAQGVSTGNLYIQFVALTGKSTGELMNKLDF